MAPPDCHAVDTTFLHPKETSVCKSKDRQGGCKVVIRVGFLSQYAVLQERLYARI